MRWKRSISFSCVLDARGSIGEPRVGTSHSFGYAALKTAFRSNVEKNKSYLILDETPRGRQLPRYLRKSVAYLVGHAKNNLLDSQADDEGLCAQLQRLALAWTPVRFAKALRLQISPAV